MPAFEANNPPTTPRPSRHRRLARPSEAGSRSGWPNVRDEWKAAVAKIEKTDVVAVLSDFPD
jgi:hypothetical protein